jgi:hypothetical protein
MATIGPKSIEPEVLGKKAGEASNNIKMSV